MPVKQPTYVPLSYKPDLEDAARRWEAYYVGDIIGRALLCAESTYYAGDSIPSFMLSFGPDEIAVFCGAKLEWNSDSGDTNWSKPCIENWEDASSHLTFSGSG